MGDSFLDKATALRDEAFAKVQTLPEYVAFVALDEAVKAMRGAASSKRTKVEAIVDALTAQGPISGPTMFQRGLAHPRRLSQADAAELVLRNEGRPMTTPELADAIVKLGATVGGSDPLINVASSLSRDGRFKSARVDGKSMWHLTALPIQRTETEAAELDLAIESAARAQSSEKGGEFDATANNMT